MHHPLNTEKIWAHQTRVNRGHLHAPDAVADHGTEAAAYPQHAHEGSGEYGPAGNAASSCC